MLQDIGGLAKKAEQESILFISYIIYYKAMYILEYLKKKQNP